MTSRKYNKNRRKNAAASPSRGDLWDANGWRFAECPGQIYLYLFFPRWQPQVSARDEILTSMGFWYTHYIEYVCYLHASVAVWCVMLSWWLNVAQFSPQDRDPCAFSLLITSQFDLINEIQKWTKEPPPTKPRRQKGQETTLPSPINEQMELR